MIIVIAPENDIPDELELLKDLFESGLRHYHFRKPHKSLIEHRLFLDQIPEKFYQYIIPHYYHELSAIYQLKGVHLQEQMRWDQIRIKGLP